MTDTSRRVALVTGAAGGIGAACAARLLRDGHDVVLLDIQDTVETTAKALDPTGEHAIGLVADVRDGDAVRGAVGIAEKRLGAPEILVNNAGFPRDSFLTKMEEKDWHDVIDVVLTGSFHCCRAVLGRMQEREWGRIINMSSRSHLGNPGQANYSAAKAGLIGFTRALALESGRFGITVNAIAPGFIETEAMKTLDNYDVLKQRSIDKSPLRRVGAPDDIAAAVAYLASDAAAYVTGETLHVTGGRYS